MAQSEVVLLTLFNIPLIFSSTTSRHVDASHPSQRTTQFELRK